MEQGFQAAEEERRRLNLGDAPIRDLDHTLVVKRIRMTKIDLHKDVASIFVNSQETGFLVIVNRRLPIEARRFHYAHGFGHSLFDRCHRSFVCSAECRQDFVEVRASAFANGFLLPESSLRRYLESLGKEVRGRTGGVELDLFSERSERDREATNVPVTGRNRRGAEPINVCDSDSDCIVLWRQPITGRHPATKSSLRHSGSIRVAGSARRAGRGNGCARGIGTNRRAGRIGAGRVLFASCSVGRDSYGPWDVRQGRVH